MNKSKATKKKKPFYLRWWFIGGVILVVFLTMSYKTGARLAEEEEAEKVRVAEAEKLAAESSPEKEVVEITPKQRISGTINGTIKREDFKHTVVSDIDVISDYKGVDGDGVNVLLKLQYNATGGNKSALRGITEYSAVLAEELTEDPAIKAITVFWELPKILDADNVAKITYERIDRVLVETDVWLAPALRE